MGKGHYEVIGTLQNGSITEMQTVYMGENIGARQKTHFNPLFPVPLAIGLLTHLCIYPAPHADMNMYAEMVHLTHQLPEIF